MMFCRADNYGVVFIVHMFSVDKVNTRVAKDGRTVRYLQRYLKDWENQPQFAGSTDCCMLTRSILCCN